MKKILLYFILAILATGCATKDKNATVATATRTVDSTTVELIDRVHDFGTITEGDKVEFSFRFKNTGNKPLIIDRAQASCGCTVPEKPEQPIAPGAEGAIKVVFNSAGKTGRQEKAILVTANASPAFPDLRLQGDVKAK